MKTLFGSIELVQTFLSVLFLFFFLTVSPIESEPFVNTLLQGCDASVLLNDMNGTETSERKAGPNLTLKGFQFIDKIKEEVETECPGVVSCSDILVLAARYGVLLAGALDIHIILLLNVCKIFLFFF